MLLMISMVKKLLEYFMKKNCKRLIKVINYMLNGKVMVIHLISGLIKKIWYNIITRFKKQFHLIK